MYGFSVSFSEKEFGSTHLLKLQSEYATQLVLVNLQQRAKRKEEIKPRGQPQLRVAPTAVWLQIPEVVFVTVPIKSCFSLVHFSYSITLLV